MRYWNDETIDKALGVKAIAYKKLASYTPDEKLGSDDIGDLMFILRQYEAELKSIKADRKRSKTRRGRQ